MAGRRARWYFSFRSPYSWLAYRELLTTYPDVAERIDWAPFWEPDAEYRMLLAEMGVALPYVPMSKAKHLYILQDVSRLVRERGLTNAWPIDTAPRWEVANLAQLAAEAQGAGREFIDAVYRARWQEGLDISDPLVIAQLAKELGLDSETMAGAHTEPALRERGLRALLDLHRDDVFGVPYFMAGRQRFWGLDRLAAFADQVRGMPDIPDSVTPVSALTTQAQGDGGHAGGCG